MKIDCINAQLYCITKQNNIQVNCGVSSDDRTGRGSLEDIYYWPEYVNDVIGRGRSTWPASWEHLNY